MIFLCFLLFLEDKLVIASDKNWLNQPQQPIDIQMIEASGISYNEDAMIEKVKEIYSVTKNIAVATNNTQWLYQRIVDAVLTQLNYDQHMLVMVGDSFERSWDKNADDKKPTNERKNYEATDVERTNFVVKWIPVNLNFF